MIKTTSTKIETRNIKHSFTPLERETIGKDLALALSSKRNLEAEFEQVKKDYKAKEATHDARIELLGTNIVNGFEMRQLRCVVVFRPQDRKKDFFLETEFTADDGCQAVLVEDMTADDFQAELIEAESKFDARERIEIFPPTEHDMGGLIVGRLLGSWYSALRIEIGKLKLEERLDSEQRSFKTRWDAVESAAKRAKKWLKEQLKEQAKGFDEPLAKALEPHRERVE